MRRWRLSQPMSSSDRSAVASRPDRVAELDDEIVELFGEVPLPRATGFI
jgi:hypothetical protein